MADVITTLPAKVTAVDTSEHELKFAAELFAVSPPVISIEVTTGTITLSKGRAKTGGSASFAAASNNKTVITLKNGADSLFYTANAANDAFTISE